MHTTTNNNLPSLKGDNERMNNWKLISEELPPENHTVWLCNPEKQLVGIGCLTWQDDDENSGWVWAYQDGEIYVDKGKIVAECAFYSEYDYTHWQSMPDLPTT